MKRDQFTFYRSYFEALKSLPARDFKAALLAICSYALDEEEPSLSGVPHSVFVLIRPTLDSGRKKAENRMNKRGTKQEQNENKRGTNEGQSGKENEGEREGEREVECERECEKDILKNPLPIGRGQENAAARVRADYLDRVNPAASPSSLEELGAFAEELGEAVCRRAIDVALDAKKATWPYIRAILRDKQARGVKSLADWEALEGRREKAPGPTHATDAKAFQRDLDWMDSFLSGGST